jgi:hypothetical protein
MNTSPQSGGKKEKKKQVHLTRSEIEPVSSAIFNDRIYDIESRCGPPATSLFPFERNSWISHLNPEATKKRKNNVDSALMTRPEIEPVFFCCIQ